MASARLGYDHLPHRHDRAQPRVRWAVVALEPASEETMTELEDAKMLIGVLAQLVSDASKLLERANAPDVEWTQQWRRWSSHPMVGHSRALPQIRNIGYPE